MKTRSVLAALLTFMVISAFAQTPENIETAFKSKYPNAVLKKIKHEQSRYVVTFANSGERSVALFDEKGNWLQTDVNMKWKTVPVPVRVSFAKSKYCGWLIENVKQVETPNGIFYSVEVDNQYILDGDEAYALAEDCCVYFTPNGGFVKEVKM
jgi:hypothetical protein